jgi:hypothetical protein
MKVIDPKVYEEFARDYQNSLGNKELQNQVID